MLARLPPGSGSQLRANGSTTAPMASSSRRALSEVDTAFDEKAFKELGRAAKLRTEADIARFGENIRIAARLYLEGKPRLNAPRLREKIELLAKYQKLHT
jgi:hypothetical protein